MPIVLVSTIVIGFTSLIITAIVICFCILDLDAAVNTATNVPILEIIYQATKNVGASNFLVFFLFYLNCVSVTGSMTTANRLIFAFARDGALPYSSV